MDYFIGISKQALFLSLIITAPPVLVALIVGLIISILQATTQIQEQTLTFVPKLVAVVVAIISPITREPFIMIRFIVVPLHIDLFASSSSTLVRSPHLVTRHFRQEGEQLSQ